MAAVPTSVAAGSEEASYSSSCMAAAVVAAGTGIAEEPLVAESHRVLAAASSLGTEKLGDWKNSGGVKP